MPPTLEPIEKNLRTLELRVDTASKQKALGFAQVPIGNGYASPHIVAA